MLGWQWNGIDPAFGVVQSRPKRQQRRETAEEPEHGGGQERGSCFEGIVAAWG